MRVVTAVSALTLGFGMMAAGGPATAVPYVRAGELAAAATTKAAYDTTSSTEKKRVDRVKTPKLSWTTCRGGSFRCASVTLPMDYDHPKGQTVKVALVKYPARTKAKIGTLFVNPGGPGGSGAEFATLAPDFLPADILNRFDVVGFDPRGVGSSSNVHCFTSSSAQAKALKAYYSTPVPETAAETKAVLASLRALGKGCSSTGKYLSLSMSTAQVARDLDVLRRAVGDSRLTYLGFSYGTYLGQVYANLFPDRTRALALDGVVDPTGWQGSTATRNEPVWNRIGADTTTKLAFDETLRRCAAAGASACSFAGTGDPVTSFATLSRRLKTTPLVLDDGSGPYVIGYAEMIGAIVSDLYQFDGPELVDGLLSDLWDLTSPTLPAAARRRAARSLAQAHRDRTANESARLAPADGYDVETDAFASVSCTDSPVIDDLDALPAIAARKAQRNIFSPLWTWNLTGCAKDAFTSRDEDAYRGSFTHKTRAKLLFVGAQYDPVTSLAAATKAANLAPNSALVSSNSWGHTAYNTSACVDAAVNRYLLTGVTPSAKVTRCAGDFQPFATMQQTVALAPVSEQLVGAGQRQVTPVQNR